MSVSCEVSNISHYSFIMLFFVTLYAHIQLSWQPIQLRPFHSGQAYIAVPGATLLARLKTARHFLRFPSYTYLSASSGYIWSLRSVWSRVMLARATACSLISTNKFVLNTNYSSAVSRCVAGQTNERPQSPHQRDLFCQRQQ